MARHFSREEIEELRSALAATSARDTDFPKAESVSDGDLIPIVQDGVNKTVGIRIISGDIEDRVISHVDEAMKGAVRGIRIRTGSSETEVETDESGKAVLGLGASLGYDGHDIDVIWKDYNK